jgi:hypothetical protein
MPFRRFFAALAAVAHVTAALRGMPAAGARHAALVLAVAVSMPAFAGAQPSQTATKSQTISFSPTRTRTQSQSVWPSARPKYSARIVAGGLPGGFSGDGGPATSAGLSAPTHIAADVAGNIYIVDNTDVVIRKVTASTGFISTVAGSASQSLPASTGDGGPATAATFSNPRQLTVDTAGNIYGVDVATANGGGACIRMVSAGIIRTIVGNCAVSASQQSWADGVGTSLVGLFPDAVTAGGDSVLYFSTGSCVRRWNATGLVSTVVGNCLGFAGTATLSADGMGTNVRFGQVSALAFSSGKLFIAETATYTLLSYPNGFSYSYTFIRSWDPVGRQTKLIVGYNISAGSPPGNPSNDYFLGSEILFTCNNKPSPSALSFLQPLFSSLAFPQLPQGVRT